MELNNLSLRPKELSTSTPTAKRTVTDSTSATNLSLRPKQPSGSTSTANNSASNWNSATGSKRRFDDCDSAGARTQNNTFDLAMRPPKRRRPLDSSIISEHSSPASTKPSHPPTHKKRRRRTAASRTRLTQLTRVSHLVYGYNSPEPRGLAHNPKTATSSLKRPPKPHLTPKLASRSNPSKYRRGFSRSGAPSPERAHPRLTSPSLPSISSLRIDEAPGARERELRSLGRLWDETRTPIAVRMQVLAGLPAVVKEAAWEDIEEGVDAEGDAVEEEEDDEFAVPEWTREVFGKKWKKNLWA